MKDNLIYAAAEDKGLVSINFEGKTEPVATEFNGTPFNLVDDVTSNTIDNKIWFTHSSKRYSVKDVIYDLVEMQPTGSIFSYDLKTQELDEIAKNLYWPNGLMVDDSGEYIYYNTLYKRTVKKLWLKGPKKGQIEVLVEGLPSYLDNY